MVGATNQRTATAAVARARSITAGVCAVVGQYRHLRCASGVCLILKADKEGWKCPVRFVNPKLRRRGSWVIH